MIVSPMIHHLLPPLSPPYRSTFKPILQSFQMYNACVCVCVWCVCVLLWVYYTHNESIGHLLFRIRHFSSPLLHTHTLPDRILIFCFIQCSVFSSGSIPVFSNIIIFFLFVWYYHILSILSDWRLIWWWCFVKKLINMCEAVEPILNVSVTVMCVFGSLPLSLSLSLSLSDPLTWFCFVLLILCLIFLQLLCMSLLRKIYLYDIYLSIELECKLN